jgi:hypothetical protein
VCLCVFKQSRGNWSLNKQGVSHIKRYVRAKEELWKLKYFTMEKYNNVQKILSKKPKSFKIL